MSVVINGTGSISGLSNVGGVSSAQSGTVLQVVNGTTNVETSNGTNTYADTNLSATITPQFSTSKILVLVNQVGCYAGVVTAGVKMKIQANGADILTFSAYTTYYVVNDVGSVSASYLDSPATTSAVTYKTQFARQTGSGTAVYVQNGGASRSTITLMEIAA